MSRGLVLSYIYTGQMQHRYNYARQMEDAFRNSAGIHAPKCATSSRRITPSQAQMRSALADVVVSWIRRCDRSP